MKKVTKLVQSRINRLARSGWKVQKINMHRGIYVLEVLSQKHFPLLSYIEVASVSIDSRGRIIDACSETGEIYTVNENLK